MTGIEFPIEPSGLLTVVGSAAFATVVAQWLKGYLSEWRYTNLLVLALALFAAVMAQLVVTSWHPSAVQVYAALLIGLVGASVATWGYETVINLLGKAGIGSRSA